MARNVRQRQDEFESALALFGCLLSQRGLYGRYLPPWAELVVPVYDAVRAEHKATLGKNVDINHYMPAIRRRSPRGSR
jgi:hypothetical protein